MKEGILPGLRYKISKAPKIAVLILQCYFLVQPRKQTQMQCLKCPVGNLRCLRFLWWALMLCSYIIHIPSPPGEGKWRKKRRTEAYSVSPHFSGPVFLVPGCGRWIVQLEVWISPCPWSCRGSLTSSWGLLAASLGFAVVFCRREIPKAPCNVGVLRWKAWKHWKKGIWKRTFVSLAVWGSSELKPWSELRAETLTMDWLWHVPNPHQLSCLGHLVWQDSIPEEGGGIKGLQRGFSPSLPCLSCPRSDMRELLHHSAAFIPKYPKYHLSTKV